MSSLFWPLTWPRPDDVFSVQVRAVVFIVMAIKQDFPARPEVMHPWTLEKFVDKSRRYAATHGPHPVHLEQKATTVVSTKQRQKWVITALKWILIITQWLAILPRIKAGPKERAGLMPHPVKLIWKQQIQLFNKVNILGIHKLCDYTATSQEHSTYFVFKNSFFSAMKPNITSFHLFCTFLWVILTAARCPSPTDRPIASGADPWMSFRRLSVTAITQRTSWRVAKNSMAKPWAGVTLLSCKKQTTAKWIQF